MVLLLEEFAVYYFSNERLSSIFSLVAVTIVSCLLNECGEKLYYSLHVMGRSILICCELVCGHMRGIHNEVWGNIQGVSLVHIYSIFWIELKVERKSRNESFLVQRKKYFKDILQSTSVLHYILGLIFKIWLIMDSSH